MLSSSHPLTRPFLIGLIYFVVAAATIATTRFGGGVAWIWVANAFLVAELQLRPRREWRSSLIACGIASFVATATLGTGIAAALPFMLINLGESVVGALLLRRLSPSPRPLETLGGVFAFIFSVGIVAPLVTAPLGGATVALTVPGVDFAANCLRWFVGHALGALAFTPLFVFVLGGDLRRWIRSLTAASATEAVLILTGVLATSVVVFSQNRLPLLFLPTLPLIVALFRIGAFGGTLSVVIIAAAGVISTGQGATPMHFIDGTPGDRLQFLQFYVAVLVMISLPVAADLSQRTALLGRLRESEGRYRLLAEHSSDIVINLDVEGRMRFVSKSVETLAGYIPDEMLGQKASEFVFPADRGLVVGAHASAFSAPGQVHIIEHRVVAADGSVTWVEASIQAIVDEAGQPHGLVSALRDVSHRRGREQELVRQAETDPLTGLLNRRGFFSGVDAVLRSHGDAPRACFALFDIDHFKKVNDSHGHSAGDHVLEEFARIARLVVRDDDLVGRLGGEEFGIFLKGASFDHAVMVCDRLRTTLASQLIRSPDGQAIWVTVSAGVVPVEPKMSREKLYRRADEALYRAKAAGRNQIGLAA
ncbi:sensor domain-containing diguanylate cyclase [Sphingosinicella sp. YJ22]|uniref:sensor domain-containing diguanylate cyclase n=1 Tax=Sphingosinicella sp. YJ22 TaxID=1104780 RepID=UPI00140A1204|nr:sensor domain-containing diguanylate cyclase [Sphingosinicella sp. YJ22]